MTIARSDIEAGLAEDRSAYFDHSPIPMWVFDALTRRFLAVNETAVEVYGYPREEFLAMRADDLRREEDVPALIAGLAGLHAGWQRTGPWRHKKRDGTLIFVDTFWMPLRFRGRDAFMAAVIDMTDRKRAEDELRRSEDRFRTLAENAQDLLFRFRPFPTPHFEYVSPASETVLGFTPEQIYADPLCGLREVHPEDAALVAPALTGGGEDRGSVVFRLKRDSAWVWLESHSVRRVADDGTVTIEGILRDVTARKQAEEAVYEALKREQAVADELRKIDDMKNTFLTALSHELRTPLTTVIGMASTLQERESALSRTERQFMLSRLRLRAEQLRTMLDELLDVNRLTRGLIKPVLHPTDVRALLAATIGGVDMGARRVVFDAEAVVALVDASLVERIVENLLSNVTRYTPAETNVWIRLSAMQDGVRIEVEDDGPGIPSEVKEHVLEAFHTTRPVHPESPGLGVGLSLVAGFARLHDGSVTLDDRPGGGTVVTVMLHAHRAQSEPPSLP